MCVDDIIITGDALGIVDLKCYLQKHFQTKDLESLRYFLSIEVAKSSKRTKGSVCLICSPKNVCWAAKPLMLS